jgi:hypothetical protein
LTVAIQSSRTSRRINRQLWNHFFVLVLGAVGLLVTWNFRQSILNASSVYINNTAGIRAVYPASWLIEEPAGAVFRARDVRAIGFKTTYQIQVLPVGSQTSQRALFDILAIQRSQTLAAYRTLAIQPYQIPANDVEATAVLYTYVETSLNPFLEQVPVVVQGLDVLFVSRGQSIIVTLLADATKFDAMLPRFETFIQQLEY